MRTILLVDADSKIPNLALAKLYRWHRENGDSVDFVRFGMPYYPNIKKVKKTIPSGYDLVYCSVIFDGNKEFISGGNEVVFGGTGVDLDTVLPDEVESCRPDYTIYPDNDCSFGFITRGCIRNCSFCKVRKKEGYIRRVANIDDIVAHKKVKFLDNNILAYRGHLDVLRELVEKKIRCQFIQGLDIRLLNTENSLMLKGINYMGEYIFAFDNWSMRDVVERKLRLLEWTGDWKKKFYVYVCPEMPIADTVRRIMFLKNNRCLPYLMRDVSCWATGLAEFWVDLAAYCNQPSMFKKMSFSSFLDIREIRPDRRLKSKQIWAEACA